MATWIAFALGCASTALLFLTYFELDAASDMPQAPLPAPGSRFGGGFGYPPYNKAIIQVRNKTYDAHSFPFSVELPHLDAPLAPLEGELRTLGEQHADPHDGERAVLDDAQACSMPESSLAGSIALVRAGGCGLSVKLLNCQAAGARAVVFENDGVCGSQYGLETVRIPGICVTLSTFSALVNTTGEKALLWSLPHGLDFTTTDVLMLLIVRPVMLFLIVCVILAFNLGCTESRRTAPQRVVSALPTHVWAGTENCAASRGLWNQEGCRICLEDFSDGCEIMTLPCGHEFHSSCVSAWLLKQREVCPLCKMGVDRERVPLLV